MLLKRRHLWYTLPLAAVSAGGMGFYDILQRMRAGTYDPHSLPSPLIGHHPPDFNLPGADGMRGFSNTDLISLPRPILVNWFASWCVACQQEAPLLGKLTDSGVPIWGIAYEDKEAALTSYLRAFKNPYQRLAVDPSGLTAINWGVYGVPETYFIDKEGIVRLRYAGPLDEDVVQQRLMPLFARYS